jgi:hypothetical protein
MIPRLLLALSFTTVLFAQPAQFAVEITSGPYDEQQRANVTVELKTLVPMGDPEELILDVNILGGISLDSWSGTCVERSKTWLQCNPASNPVITMRVKTDFDHRTGFVSAVATWRDRGFRRETREWRRHLFRYAREFVVTSGDDAGPGSLRQAILDANASCTSYQQPCLLRFEAETIRPRTPLPAVSAQALTIDGAGRAVVDGSLLQVPANGLLFDSNSYGLVIVRGLEVRGFPENGIEIRWQQVRIESCAITGNRSRGIAVTTGLASGYADINDCVISDNGRSGIFADTASIYVFRSAIERNGASGIFVGRLHDALIVDNVIAENAHFGVGTVRDNRDVDVGPNRITGNRAGPIDIDLDGSSFFTPAADRRPVPPNGPILTSATYDAATNTTTVRGRLEHVEFFYFLTYEVQFYATTAANEADQYLGAIHLDKADFTVTFRGDLRGRFITANTIRWVHDEITDRGTSELGAPIEVR